MPLSPYDQQLAAIRARQATDTRVNIASQNVNPQLVAGTVAHATAYPFISPQTAYALAQTGAQPGDPLAQTVATGVLNHKNGGFWGELGHIVTAPMRAVSTIQHDLKSAARVGLTALETPLQLGMGAYRDIASATGDVGAGIVGGAATGAAVGGISGAGAFSWLTAPVGAAIGGVVGGVSGALAQSKGIEVKGGFVNPLAQASGTLALGNLISGNKVDLGSGFIPGGAIKAEQAKNAEAAANINGHALTPGRMLAAGVFRPGSTPYNVLSGVTDAVDTWELDPSRYVLEEVGAQNQARKLIEGVPTAKAGPITGLARRAGLLEAADPAVDMNKAREFLTSDGAAQRFVQKVTETGSASEIRAASNGKLSSQLANQLAAHTTEQGVLDTLLSHIESGDLREAAAVRNGRGITSVVPTFRPPARLAAAMDRLGGVLPEHSVDVQDIATPGGAFKLDNAVDQMDNFLKQARYSAADRQPILDRLMQSTTADEAHRVFTDTIHSDLRQRLLGLNMSEPAIDNVLKTTAADKKLLMSQVSSELADNTIQQSLTLGGDSFAINKPNEVMEQAATHIQLPDARALRRMTTPNGALRAIYNSSAFLNTEHAADWFMGSWKKLNLARPALTTRMVAMGQAKMAANGLEAPLADPINLFSSLLHRSPSPSMLEGLTEGTPLSQAEELGRIGNRMSVHLTPEDLAAHQTILSPGDEGFGRAWAARVAEQHADPVARTIATQGYEGAADSFWNGGLAAERERLAADLNKPELLTRDGADAYVKDTVGSHLKALTADNPQLMESIASGRLLGTDLLKAHPGGLVNPDFEAALGKLIDDPNIQVPNQMRAAKAHEIDPDYGNKVGRVTSFFYSTLVGKPMDYLVQHPAFNQLFWKSVADHAGLLDEEGVAALRSRLATDSPLVKMPGETRAAIQTALDHPNAGQGAVSYDKLEQLTKADAVGRLQDMTIDMSKKQGWQDTMRHMSPFLKHWQQELTQWVKIATDNPQSIRKAEMFVQGAEGNGWFHKDQNGTLVFNYPGSNLISKVLTGTPGSMTGKVGGLSQLTTDLVPGAGPIISLPAGKLLPNRPEFDDIRNFLNPYGDPTAKGAISSVLPSWAQTVQKALSDPNNDRDAANTTMQTARYLVSTGKFSMDTPENIDKTLTEAGSRAKKLLTLQAIGKFVLPASPTPVPMAQDRDGRTVVARLLSDDLQAMRKADYANSTENFLSKYGDSALLFLQSASRPIVPGAPATKEQDVFARANPDLAKAFPNIVSFFAPQGAQTNDPSHIINQIAAGQRQALTPTQQIQLANKQVGSMVFYQAKAALGPRISSPQQAMLDNLKVALRDRYPGFDVPIVGLQARLTDDPTSIEKVVVPEIKKALGNPKMADSQAGQAANQYLQVRDAVDAVAQQRGLKSWQTAAHADDLRGILRQAATILGKDNIGFQMMFDELLSREMKTDTVQAAPSV